jgi:hypothetical protein
MAPRNSWANSLPIDSRAKARIILADRRGPLPVDVAAMQLLAVITVPVFFRMERSLARAFGGF